MIAYFSIYYLDWWVFLYVVRLDVSYCMPISFIYAFILLVYSYWCLPYICSTYCFLVLIACFFSDDNAANFYFGSFFIFSLLSSFCEIYKYPKLQSIYKFPDMYRLCVFDTLPLLRFKQLFRPLEDIFLSLFYIFMDENAKVGILFFLNLNCEFIKAY